MSKSKKPNKLSVGGETYRATVLHVVEQDEHGRPRTLRLLCDDETGLCTRNRSATARLTNKCAGV